MKGKTDTLDFIKINVCFVKDLVKRMKRHATEWENISAKHISYLSKDCYPEYTKKAQNSTVVKEQPQIQKILRWTKKSIKRHFMEVQISM